MDMVVLDMSVGSRITELRRKRNLTQEGLAKKVGISRAALSHYEKDRREPDYDTLIKLSDFFDVDIGYILGVKNKTEELLNDPETQLMFENWKDMSKEERKEAIEMIKYIQFKNKRGD